MDGNTSNQMDEYKWDEKDRNQSCGPTTYTSLTYTYTYKGCTSLTYTYTYKGCTHIYLDILIGSLTDSDTISVATVNTWYLAANEI